MRTVQLNAEFVVVGGGLSGMAAAVAAAREGVRTILVHDRSVPGGNASSEVRMWVCGAHGENRRETGLIEEILLENLARNPDRNFSIWDSVLYGFLKREPNLTTLLDTVCLEADIRGKRICRIRCYSSPSQTWYEITAPLFSDCSGDSILATLAGAEMRYGRESRMEFGESIAPLEADRCTMGMSCLLQVRETDEPHDYTPPPWARRFTDDSAFRFRSPQLEPLQNFWWIEFGGDGDALHDTEKLREELLAVAFGAWDYLKNHPDNAGKYRNWALEWVGFLPGKRESNRCVGDYLLNQNDVRAGGHFPDIIAYGGWPMDDHCPGGFRTPEVEPTIFHPAPSPFGIPYRCVYSVNIENLFFAGRNISVTHTAMSSCRVMATCALLGQAVGTAAALAVRYRCAPRAVGQQHIGELQQLLMRDDCFLPGLRYTPPVLTREAALCANCGDPSGLRGGLNRAFDGVDEAWRAAPGAMAEYRWETPRPLAGCRLVFDSDLNRQEKNIVAVRFLDTPRVALPETLVRRFRLEYEDAAGNWREIGTFDNEQRLRKLTFEVIAAALRLTILETGSGREERIFAWDVC